MSTRNEAPPRPIVHGVLGDVVHVMSCLVVMRDRASTPAMGAAGRVTVCWRVVTRGPNGRVVMRRVRLPAPNSGP
jgi:hypothetical protein